LNKLMVLRTFVALAFFAAFAYGLAMRADPMVVQAGGTEFVLVSDHYVCGPGGLGGNWDDDPSGTDDLVVHTAPGGQIIEAICIKPGTESYGPFTEDGSVSPQPGCTYAWTGIGTPTVTVTRTGSGAGCPGISHIEVWYGEGVEELDVSKTAETSFVREHLWDIDKYVETENGFEHDGFPKIWLDGPGDEGDETATWTVDVTYEGYEDSGHNVSGVITIENVGDLDAVITAVDDVLGGTPIDVDCGVTFPYTLEVGDTLECTYDEDGEFEGFNEVTVTTERDEYFADAAIIWGDPDEVFNETVNVEDISDLPEFGTQDLGTVTAPDDAQFTYEKGFAFVDYADFCGEDFRYDNTATIVETEQSADATLLVNVRCEELDVSKTADTSFDREHFWDIDKSVGTENGYEHDDLPKIWLFTDGSGDETATWTVDVTYEGYEDSDHNVSGTITIDNVGTLDAVITAVDDVLGGVPIDVDCGVTFPYTLEVGDTLECTYDEDGYVEGFNEVTVTTERDTYFANAEIVWGDPDEEINETVNVQDISDLPEFGTQDLGSVTAPDDAQFTYDKHFAFADFADCGDFRYDNTATIVETGQSADATLLVNVQCFVLVTDSAWAMGDPNVSFCDSGFDNWGWTNPIGPAPTSDTWPLYAGAAQCDPANGTLVGSVDVVYDGGFIVSVTFNVVAPFSLVETHVYAGYDEFPTLRNGNPTTAPGRYTNNSPFDGSEVFVIAHAVVGVPEPDPDFGP
jgi:hypothetical protein